MRRKWLVTGIVATILMVGIATVWLRGVPQINTPPPIPAMPAVVTRTVESLLAEYEDFLRSQAPAVFASLQPGLSDAEIDRLEVQHAFKLPADLRALYRWHNGATSSDRSSSDTFPEHEFVPLPTAIATRAHMRQAFKEAGWFLRLASAALVGHRDAWLGLIVDAAGDGYFFDSGRSEAQGSFFFCFAETNDYIFYPAFRNYLAAVVDGQKAGIYGVGSMGIETKDFGRASQWCLKYGAESDR